MSRKIDLISVSELEAEAEAAAGLLRALGNPQRLRLTCALLDGEFSVSELETRTEIHQPALSKELGKLREAGVIEGRRQSKSVFYRLVDPRAAAIISVLCGEDRPLTTPAVPRKTHGEGSVFARILPGTSR